MNREFKDLLFFGLILFLALLLPSMFGGEDPIISLGVSLICNLLFLLYIGNNAIKSGALSKRRQAPYWKHILILLPLIISFMAGPVSWVLSSGGVIITYGDYSWLYFLNTLVIVLNEEFIFRLMLQNRIFSKSRIKRILVSAGIYALFDVILFLQTFNLIGTLLAMVESFILGLFVGAIMEYGHSIYPCIIFHFLYEFFTSAYGVFFIIDAPLFEPLTLIFTVAAVAYLAGIYLLYLRKKE
ncbi:MAG: CPBP family intramembrane metalloprotease [Bacilli bacterium]|nr:CPBP family intramembrane metalloprotease [Bacilli bacterium]